MAMAEQSVLDETTLALLSSSVASASSDKLAELRRRVAEQLKLLDEVQKRCALERHKLPKHAKMHSGPLLIKVGGQGYRLWKASHEALATEISSRTPHEVASPVVRGESQRFQAELKATVGALDISEKAGRVMQELLNSEREYFTDLGMLQRLYVKPLTEGVKTKGFFLTERDLGDLFSNFDDIFKLNLDLLRQLEVESKKKKEQMDAGQLFLDFADKFQVYAVYCANANAAKKRMENLALTNKRFAEFCEKARGHSAHKGLDIGSFLIKPLQRLCQYPLLLRELLEALPDQQNVPYAKLRQAHKVMSETVETVNNMLKSIRKRNELQRLSDLLSFDGFRCSVDKPGRQFSMSMPFRVRVVYPGDKEGKKWKNWEAWLLSDLVVFGEREKAKPHDRLTVKVWLPLEQVVVEAEDSSGGASLVLPSGGSTGSETPLTTRQSRRLTKQQLDVSTGKDNRDGILLLANGAQFFLSSDDKAQSAVFLKKLLKKTSAIREHLNRSE